MLNLSEIKLIIWDLDETLWTGILSDGTQNFSPERTRMIRDIVDTGTMCSICSKNDEFQVKTYLTDKGIDDLFVFRSINWSPKGERVKQIINEMGLREVNVLFVDDNAMNRGEVIRLCPNINVASDEEVDEIQCYYRAADKRDLAHKRLKQYKVLEVKQQFRATVGSNDSFLMESNIVVTIARDCVAHLERIEDLVARSNQLNFTKCRSKADELLKIINDDTIDTGYVSVSDRFGDYGIVGFFAISQGKCLHFTFSCRTLNMGVEQYVYHQLGKPDITIVGEVASSLDGECPNWINSSSHISSGQEKIGLGEDVVLLKGPCDLQQLFSFVKETGNIITEFSYVSENGVSIETDNCTTHILQSRSIVESVRQDMIKHLPFVDEKLYVTRIFDPGVKVVLFSLFMESHLGIYENITSGVRLAFGEYTNDLTDETKWEQYINGTLFVANCRFTKEDLVYFRDHYRYLGRLSVDEVINNLRVIRQKMPKETLLILNLGSETPYLGVSHEVNKEKHLFNAELNAKIRSWVKENKNVDVIDVNQFIKSQDDFIDSITHFKKRIYYAMSGRLIEILNQRQDQNLHRRSMVEEKVYAFFKRVKRKLFGEKK